MRRNDQRPAHPKGLLQMNVFEAFPNAIEQMSIVEVDYGTITGNTTGGAKTIRVIKDEVTTADPTNSPNAATIATDTLLYVVPADLPTTDTSELVSGYIIRDAQGRDYEIVDAGAGKNQHTGQLEHIELKIRPTETIARSN